MKTIVLQGDSITDANRNPQFPESSGNGYATMVKGWLGCEYPGQYHCYNRGIAGNRIGDLYARIREDIINLKPDIVSLLIGVNDVWHEIMEKNGIREDLFETIYDLLITELKTAMPDLRIMIMEPFVLKGSATNPNWDVFYTEVRKRADRAREIARKYGLAFVSLQAQFEEATKKAPDDHWLKDGVHPTLAGHELIKKEWIKAFGAL